jgi:hypothetical protein
MLITCTVLVKLWTYQLIARKVPKKTGTDKEVLFAIKSAFDLTMAWTNYTHVWSGTWDFMTLIQWCGCR